VLLFWEWLLEDDVDDLLQWEMDFLIKIAVVSGMMKDFPKRFKFWFWTSKGLF